jgi:hypothetical protein
VIHRIVALAAALAVAAAPATTARAQGEAPAPPALSLGEADILGSIGAFHVESITTRVTSFDQFGHGYQAQGGRTAVDPGSERATIFEPQLELDATQGSRIKHRVIVPIDVVTNASADAIDLVTIA